MECLPCSIIIKSNQLLQSQCLLPCEFLRVKWRPPGPCHGTCKLCKVNAFTKTFKIILYLEKHFTGKMSHDMSSILFHSLPDLFGPDHRQHLLLRILPLLLLHQQRGQQLVAEKKLFKKDYE